MSGKKAIIEGVARDYDNETLPWISEHIAMLSQFADETQAGQGGS